ncbi:acyl-CoA thioesterase [Burkholderia ubonensis]|uniref:acyl-CoA thioesterase n=1 Tax=Burkholderia ubonensis TaxID=101571 RepID=UPI0009B2E920|nr:thioesterase family protein [Burkholderia ubonensis]
MEKRYFETPIEVRYRDTDSMGHVIASVYYEYMMHAYLSFMHKLMDIPMEDKIPQIMGRSSCEYVKPARYGDLIMVRSSVTRFGTKSLDVEYLMESVGGVGHRIATGSSSHIMYDYKVRQPILISDAFKKSVLDFQTRL